jgi:hypothetical protein
MQYLWEVRSQELKGRVCRRWRGLVGQSTALRERAFSGMFRIDIGHREVLLCTLTPGCRGDGTHRFVVNEDLLAGLHLILRAVQF